MVEINWHHFFGVETPSENQCQRCYEKLPWYPGRGRYRRWCKACAVIMAKKSANRAKAKRYRENTEFKEKVDAQRRRRLSEPHVAYCRWEDDGGALASDHKTNIDPFSKRCSQCLEPRPLGWYCKAGEGRMSSACKLCRKPKRSRDRYVRRARMNDAERVRQRDILAIGERQEWLCACGCGANIRHEYHIDHILPVARGGRHTLSNLQLMTPRCNMKKGAR